MKQTIQRCSSALTRMLLILMLLLTGSASAWGENESITLANGVGTGSGTSYSITWSGTSCDITQTKENSSTSVNSSYISAPRWYQSHKIAFKAKSGYTLTGATIICTTDAYATALKNSTYSTGASATASSSKVTITTSGDFDITMGAQSRISSITISYTTSGGGGGNTPPNLSSIAIKTAPTKTTYTEGECFDPTGLVITKTMTDATTEDVTYDNNTKGDFSFNPLLTTALQTSNDKVTITYGGKTVDQAITVNAIPTHTAHFSVNGTIDNNNDYVAKEGAAITFPADPADISDKKFVGWTKTSNYSNATTAPSDLCTSANMGNADVTYYAVFATQSGSPAVETKTQTLQYDTWTYSGSTTDKSSYRLFHAGSYIESASFDRTKLTKVIVYGGTYGGNSYNKLNIGDGTNTWKDVTVSGSSQTGTNTYTEGTALSGNGTIRITSNSGSATSNGVRISKVEIFTMEGGYTNSNYCTTVEEITLSSISVSGTQAEFWKGDTFNHNGMTVTATWSDDSQTDVTSEAEFSTPDMSTPGVQTVTVTYQGKTDTYNIEVKTIANSLETAYTIAEAKALFDAGKDLSSEVYVMGTISEIVTAWSDQYNNITYNISDDGKTTSEQFQLFRCVTNNGAVGDDVIAKGTLTKYSTTYELSAGNTIVSITKATTLSIADITVALEENINPEVTTNIVGDYTIDYSSDNTDVVSASGNTLATEGVGTATITATISATGYKGAQTTFTVNVTSATATLESITISGELTTSTYTVGDDFNFSGLTATGNYSDASNADLTSAVEWSIEPATLSAGMTSVTVKATFDDVTGSAVYSIKVNKKTASITIADIVLGIDDSIDIEATTTPADATLSYSITEGSDKITLEGSRITAVAEGSATVKASYAGDETYAACEKSFTVTVNNTKTASIDYSFSATSGRINEDISYEAFKGNAGTAPAVNNNNLRLYQNGGYVTISGIKGVKIQSVKLTTSGTYNSTTVGYCVDDEVAPTTGENVAKNAEYTISNLDNQSVSIYCLGTDKDTRLEIAALEVKYTKEEVTLSSIAVSGEYTTEFIQNTTFNHDGAIVTAIFSDGDEQDVTASATFSTPDMTTTGEKTVNISYTYEGDTKATSYNINVTAETVTSIALSGTYKTAFKAGETFTHEGVVVTATYNSGRNAVVTNEANFSTPDMSQAGNQTITVEFDGHQTTYTIIVLSANNLFYESFDTNDGKGGNDDQWSGSIASNNIQSDNDGWTFASANGAYKCAKFGTGSAKGSAQTPAIEFSGAAEITFKAAAWNGNSEGTTLNLSATSGTLSKSSVTLTKGAWTDYTVYITGVETSTRIKFEAANASNNRFFLDEIYVNELTSSESISISEYGLATCVTRSPLLFTNSGVTAYKLVVDPVKGKVILSSVAQVPAGTPILVSGKEGTHAVPVIASAEEVSTDLQCSDDNVTSTNDRIIYYLGVVNGSATFRPLEEGATLKPGKCYFEVPSSAPSLHIVIDDEEEGNATAIASIGVESLEEATYDLLGQKNSNAKGLMIRNGKVIFVK